MIPAELHSHLYGCLTVDDLYWMAGRRPWRREIYSNSHKRTYGTEPPLDEFFRDDADGRRLIREHYYYTEAKAFPDGAAADFVRFQTCFDLGIAVAHTDAEELAGVMARVVEREPAAYVEYRQLFSPLLDEAGFREKVLDLCRACDAVDRDSAKTTPRIAVSLQRHDESGWMQYRATRALMREHEVAARMIVGLDFCAQEEGYPPKDKTELFHTILEDNATDPEHALAILYHVGESYKDKSVESAVRWVVEAARMGAHRLGHCVALGVAPEFYAGGTRREILSERRDQIEFELLHQVGLERAGIEIDSDALHKEREAIIAREQTGAEDDGEPATVEITYDPRRVERLRRFQNWAMNEVRGTGAVIESCPTSNLRIAGLGRAEFHPLRRFLDAGLPVVIGADDPGILDTSLDREFELIREWRITPDEIKAMQDRADRSRSDRLSGRRRD